MVTRILTAAVGILVGLGLLYLGGFAFFLLILFIALKGVSELSPLFFKVNLPVNKPLAMIGTTVILVAFYYQSWLTIFVLFALILMIQAIHMIYDFSRVYFPTMAGTMVAIGYISLSFGFVLAVRPLANGFFLVILLMAIIWGTDTGAYFIGTYFCKNKLAPAVSPKKSYEGAVGGTFLAIILSLLLSPLAGLYFWGAILLAIIVSLTAQIGDLFESTLKRKAGVKDSGTILPGHGGVLDRFDGFVFAAPLYYGMLELINLI